MNEFLIKLQKNIFLITVACSMLFGLTLAYGCTVGLSFYLQNGLPGRKNVANNAGRRVQRNVPSVDKYYEIVSGPFFRGAARISPDAASASVATAGEITVLGVTTGDVYSARVLIQEKGKDPDALAIGQSIAGYKVAGIRSSYVLLKVGEQTVRIEVGEKSGQATAPANTTKPVATNSKGAQVVKVSLSRARLKQMMEGKGMGAIQKYNKFTMKTGKGGKILGVKLAYVHPQKSPLAQLGAKQGDIMRRFNGEKLDNSIKMLKLYESLQKMNKVTLDIERAGKLITFEVSIQ